MFIDVISTTLGIGTFFLDLGGRLAETAMTNHMQ
jgi:hypothetical protein